MKWLKKLDNPFLLGAQGFLAGAILFAATHPEFLERHLESKAPAAETQAAAAR
ncbi:MAG: hypothetical protein ACK40O_00200 [Allosphingosinicella sp.]